MGEKREEEMKREIHITLDIDTKTHTGKQQMIVTEDGRRKKDWKVEEAITVTHALILMIFTGNTFDSLRIVRMMMNFYISY